MPTQEVEAQDHENGGDDTSSIVSPTQVIGFDEVVSSDYASSYRKGGGARHCNMTNRDQNIHGDAEESIRIVRSSPHSPGFDDVSQTSCRSALRLPHSESSVKPSTTPRWYRSDRSFTWRDSNRSLGSHHLMSFYSSRRSVTSRQDSSLSLESSSANGPNQVFDSTWNVEGAKKLDISPRRPSKRVSIEHGSSYQAVPSPLLSADTAPRQPFKRFSIDLSSSNEENFADRPIAVNNDTTPKFPRQRISLNNGSTQQDIHVPLLAPPTSIGDTSPRMPQKQVSVSRFSTQQDIHVSPWPSVSNAGQQEIYVIPPSEELETGYDSEFHGGGSSVVSELTTPTQIAELNPSLQEVLPTSATRRSNVFQQNLRERRAESQRSLVSFPLALSQTRTTGGRGGLSSRSLGGRSARSAASQSAIDMERHDSCRSLMSTQSHLTLSIKVQTLLEMAADVVNSELLEAASKSYQKAIHAAGSEIMNINIQMGNVQGDDSSASTAMRNGYHEDLRMIGIIIGMLRTKMAILYADDGDYERAIDLSKGAVQVHRHQPALKIATASLNDVDDLAGLMVLIIERLDSAQTCLEDHKELLDKIDLHSNTSDFSDVESVFSSPKEIVFDMVERSAQDDESAISHRDGDALEMLSVHAAEQDKHDEGIKYLRDALQIHLVALGMKHPRTGKTLLRVAKMYRGTGNDRNNEDLVLGYFHQTAAVLQRSNLSQRARVSVLNDIAVIHMRRNDFDEAIKFLLDSLHACDEDMEEDCDGADGRHVATLQVWRNLGECYMQLRQFKSAEGAYLKALDIQRNCLTIQETAEKLNLRAAGIEKSFVKMTSDTNMADTICRIGKARSGNGGHKKALGIFREALVVLTRSAATDKDRPDRELLEKRDQLTHVLYCIAEAECANEDYDKAQQMYKLSIKLRNSTGAEKKDKRMTSRIHCLTCYVGIGDVLMKLKEFPKARKQYKDALTLSNHVNETHPIVFTIRQKLKEAEEASEAAANVDPKVAKLEQKADSEIERGALDMATETLKELLVIRRAALKRLKEKGIDTTEQVYAIACLLQTFGFVFAKNGDDENAERAFKDASRLFRKGGNTGAMRATL